MSFQDIKLSKAEGAPKLMPEAEIKASQLQTSSEVTNDSSENGNGGDDVISSPRSITGLKWGLVVLSILSSTFLFSLDNTIVAVVQPAIVRQFESVEKIAWLPVAFLLGASGTNLFWGQCYKLFNPKPIYIICVAIFEVGSAICGASRDIDMLITGRAICGLGGAGMYTGVMVLISCTTSEPERPIYFGLTGLTWGLGTILGPILGGVFTDSNASWRWAFYINLVIGGLCAPIYFVLLPTKPVKSQLNVWHRLKLVDWLGTLLLCGSVASLIMAIAFGGTLFSWESGSTIALFVVTGALFIAFVIQQVLAFGTSEDQRIFPVAFLKSPIMVMMFTTTAAASVTIFVPVYFVPLYFQFVRNYTALRAGVQLLPYIAFNVTVAIANGAIMGKAPYYMPWYLFAGVFTTVGSALMYNVDRLTSTPHIWGYTILIGIGSGAFVQLSFTVVQTKTEPRLIPVAIGFCTFAQLAGPAFALAISNAVFLNEATTGISKLDSNLPIETIRAVISGAASHRMPGLSSEMQSEALDIILAAMNKSYILALTGGALTLFLSLLMKRERLVLGASTSS